MARTPLATKVGDAALLAQFATEHDLTVAQALDAAVSRREMLRRAAIFGAGAAVASTLGGFPKARAAGSPRIAVVGAGLAGLTAAYRLKQAGYSPTVYEAADRVGGRCWTIRGAFAQNQIAEHGGELIDQGHVHIRQLANELGLTLENLLSAQPNGSEDLLYFDGAPYSFLNATNDLKDIWQQIHSDVSSASYPTLYSLSTQRGRELDQMSILDWINRYVPASKRGYDVGPGIRSKLGQFLDVAYNIEYGAETNVQSSLNMLYLIGYAGQGNLRLFGKSNEKYHVVGGNDQIPTRLAASLGSSVALGKELTAVALNSDGTYKLTFRGNKTPVTADRVVLALPFSMLRSIDYSKAGFGSLKDTAIREQGMGTNSKLHVQFSDRYWYQLNNNGNSYADTGYQITWEVTRAQPGTAGILVDYTGGNVGSSFGSGTPDGRARQFLAQLEPVMPGITSHYNGKATVDHWPSYPWTKGSYSYWKVGQYTKFSGVEREQRGKVHFCGEHTSIDFQGYLNGAVETGQRAADEVLADYKARNTP
ncbi:MAG: monoamine oxidase [Actinomycetota bacterium]|jgi:monoamine oxidase|nr:monoamine oxidase [Actinomycetota bacterium]